MRLWMVLVLALQATTGVVVHAAVFSVVGGTVLSPTSGGVTANYGNALAASSSGIVAIGAYQATLTQSAQGTAFLYNCSSATACTQGSVSLVGDAVVNAFYGQSLALQWPHLVVGAGGVGKAFVYTCASVNTCSLYDTLVSDTGASSTNNFGVSVDVLWPLVLVGASATSSQTGAAFIFDCTSAPCALLPKLLDANGQAGDQFGFVVGHDGTIVFVGAPANGAGRAGKVVLFDCSSASAGCEQGSTLRPSDSAASDQFGWHLAAKASYLVVGAIGRSSSVGAAYVFQCSSAAANCTRGAALAPAASGNGFRNGVSWPTIVTSSSTGNAVYVYTCTGISSCTLAQTIVGPGGVNNLGSGVALACPFMGAGADAGKGNAIVYHGATCGVAPTSPTESPTSPQTPTGSGGPTPTSSSPSPSPLSFSLMVASAATAAAAAVTIAGASVLLL